jgi:hypothetical protein
MLFISLLQSAGDPLTAMQLVESGLSACRSSADQYDMLIEALRMHTQQIFMAKTHGVAAAQLPTAAVPAARQASAPSVPVTGAQAASRPYDVPIASTMQADALAAASVSQSAAISMSELASPAPKPMNISRSVYSVAFTPEHEPGIGAAPFADLSPGEQAVMTALTPGPVKTQGRLCHTPSSGATASPGESAVRTAMNTPLPIQARIADVFFSPASPASLALSMLAPTSTPAPATPFIPAAGISAASLATPTPARASNITATPVAAVFASDRTANVASTPAPSAAAVQTEVANAAVSTPATGAGPVTPDQQQDSPAIGIASDSDAQQEDDAIDTAILRAALEMGKAKQVSETIAAQNASVATPATASRASISFAAGSSVKRLSPEQRAALRVLSTPTTNNKSNVISSQSKGFTSASKPKSASKAMPDADSSAILNLGSRIVLEAVRATPALEKRIGSSTYLTSVRRSVRVKTASKTHDKDSLDGVTKSVSGEAAARTVDVSPSQEAVDTDLAPMHGRQLYQEMERAAGAPEVVTPEKEAQVETPEKGAVPTRVPASILRSTARRTDANPSVRFMSPTSPGVRVARVAFGTAASPEATAAAALRSSLKSGVFARTPGSASTTPSKARRELVSEPTPVFAKCEKNVIIDVEMPSSTLAEANGAWMANPYIPFGGGLDPRTGKPHVK